jgi:hypothetical protein
VAVDRRLQKVVLLVCISMEFEKWRERGRIWMSPVQTFDEIIQIWRPWQRVEYSG